MDNTLDVYADDISALSIIYAMESDASATTESFIRWAYLLESGASSDVVMESGGDIIASIINSIKKFIEKIKDFFKRILLYLKAAFGDLTEVSAQLKSRLNEMSKISFTISGYKFTVLDRPAPNIDEFKKIVSSYNEDMKDIASLKMEDVKTEINEWLSDEHLEKLRGQVLGSNEMIADDEFTEEIRKYYRDGEDKPKDINVDKSMVNEIIGHAKRLEDTKKSAIKDRDNLITLLNKTEEFFNRTIYPVYRGTTKLVDMSTINVDNNKFSKESNTKTVTDNQAKDISVYATLKSRQVNKIGAIITSVACERANALKDQIKQEKTILRKCLFEYKNGTSKPTTTTESTGINGVDYVTVAEQSCISTQRDYNALMVHTLTEEGRFLMESVNSGEVFYLMEADSTHLVGKLKETVLSFVRKIVTAFRKKALENTEKYGDWINDVWVNHKDEMVAKAREHAGLKMYAFWKTKPKADGATLARAITTAYGTSNYTDVSFAGPYLKGLYINGRSVGTPKVDTLKDTEIRKPLLNYFRVSESAMDVKPVALKGNELISQLDGMCKYILSYKDIPNVLTRMEHALENAEKKLSVTESTITGNTYLGLIGQCVCESDILLCKDYEAFFGTPVYEATPGVAVTGTKPATGGNTTSGQVRKAVNANAAGAKEAEQSITAVKDVEDKAKDVSNASGIKEEKTNTEKVAYKAAVDHFFKIAIAAYQQAREEQFIAYLNAIAEIAGARPKFDENGKYIPVKWGKEETNQTEGETKEELAKQEEKK